MEQSRAAVLAETHRRWAERDPTPILPPFKTPLGKPAATTATKSRTKSRTNSRRRK
jgi:hypothetical protein